jgi:hypothetical protein
MAEANPPKGFSIDENRDKLTIRCKGNLGAGIAMTGLALAFGLPIGGFAILNTPLSEDNFSFVCVFGPILTLVLFLGIRILVNTTIITADENQLIVQVRPLPFSKAKRLSAAEIQWLEIELKRYGTRSRNLHYRLIARHRDASSTRLMTFKGFDLKESAHFAKEKLEKRLGLWSDQAS